MTSTAGAIIGAIDPLEAVRQFMTQGFVDVRTVDELWPLLYAPIIVTALILAVRLPDTPRHGSSSRRRPRGSSGPGRAEREGAA